MVCYGKVNSIMNFLLSFFRDVPETESLLELHQQRKSEIDAREEGFSSVVLMGKTLLARNHYASEDVSICKNISVVFNAL